MFSWTIMGAHSTFLFYSFCFIFIAHYECKIIKMKLDRHAYFMPSKLFVFPVWRLGQDVEFAFSFYFNPTMEIHWDDYEDHVNVPCNEPIRNRYYVAILENHMRHTFQSVSLTLLNAPELLHTACTVCN